MAPDSTTSDDQVETREGTTPRTPAGSEVPAGTVLGSYRIQSELGRGGMGVVYRATDTRLDRNVAIKTLPENRANDPDRLARFEREIKLIASLNHPNILTVHDVGREQDTSFVVTELATACGTSLTAVTSMSIWAETTPVSASLTVKSNVASGVPLASPAGV